MVSGYSLARALMVFAPLAESVLGQTYQPTLPLLLDATLEDLKSGLDAGSFTSVDLVKAYIARILEVNSTLHVVNEINPDAQAIASALDEERACGASRGPLHGLPILLKDDIATADNMDTAAGTWALVGAKVSRDAGVVAKLRTAGAIILGKTTMSELNGQRVDDYNSTYAAFGGQMYGAYYPNMDPGGTSSGSAVAASIGLSFGALGAGEYVGILSPADSNNIVAIQPSLGLVSRSLLVDIGKNHGAVGPMTRTVKDAAYILQAIAGQDPFDNYTSAIPWGSGAAPDYVAACKLGCLKGKRLGVPRNALVNFTGLGMGPPDSFEAALHALEQAGAIIVENTNYTAWEEFYNDSTTYGVDQAAFVPSFEGYLSQLSVNPYGIKTVQDMLNFTQNFPLENYPNVNTDGLEEILALNYTNTDYQAWVYYQKMAYYGGDGGLLGALKTYNLDAIVLPTDYSYYIPVGVGAPVITVPMGAFPNDTVAQHEDDPNTVYPAPNYPYGIAFLGPPFSEELLLGLAYGYEQATNFRQKIKPYLVPRTELKDVIGRGS